MENNLNILLFGNLVELMSTSTLQLPFVNSSDELKKILFEKYPLLQHKEFAITINQKIIHKDCAILPNSEIALLPPFSGG